MINESLAHFSDLAFEMGLAGYIMALVCFGIEFAAKRGVVPTAAEATSAAFRSARVDGRVAVGGAPADFDRGGPAIGVLPSRTRPARRPIGPRFGLAGIVVLGLGFLAHVTAIVTRGVAAGRAPWGNLMEISSMICAFAVVGFLAAFLRTRSRTIGFFVLIPVVILMYVAQSALYTTAGTLVPALHSYWLVIHVLAVSLSSGVLMFAGVCSGLYLLRSRYEKKVGIERIWAAEHLNGDDPDERARALVTERSPLASLPSLATLDKLAYRSTIVAFPIFTFAVIAGAMWAEVAWGRYWGWDPKETCAFVTWVCYAAYLHARSTAGWRGTRSAWISVLGFVSMMFNLFVINLLVSGLHSYAGLN